MLSDKTTKSERLRVIYRRIKNNCEWPDFQSFREWYECQAKKRQDRCAYCGLPEFTEKYYGRTFREGRRGVSLEVDRKNNTEKYSFSNCVLACYPCNNAKSDVFSYDEFLEIGQTIGRVKRNCYSTSLH